jgi:hypothetical protein
MAEREGTCHCGQLRVVVTGEPGVVSICSCLDCQRRTGSAFGWQAGFPAARVRVVGRFSDFSRISDESDRKEHIFHFCPDCGTTVFHTEPTQPDRVVISAGVFADPDFPQPTISGYDHRRYGWIDLPETVWAHGQNFDLWNESAKQLYEEGHYTDAADAGRALIVEHPNQVYLHYNVACCESLAGRRDSALVHLKTAIDGWAGFREMARGDSDFDPVRDDPQITALMATDESA